ncbi:VanZ family protein [Algibacillus agarilyticus]|uniref:VanZ family protein n=1 Tax=Algibacillus agarilyticus TaxID=2234133 RepID=UPI000DD0181E|nr:VanZ family protein [Algibacillus agarilyticus]
MKQLLHLIQSQWLLFTIIIILPISILSLYPVDNLPSVPGSDKTHHFIAYGALAFPVALARPNKWLIITLFLLGYSGVIELIQPYVNRYGEWLDLGANGLGLVFGIGLASFARWAVLKQKLL